MGKWSGIFTIPGILLLAVCLSTNLFSAQVDTAMQSLKPTIQQSEISNPPPGKSNLSNPQSAIQNLSSTSTGDPQLDKAEFVQKTKKLQIPFIANNGQVDKQVKFYANTFGGTVFVTKDGEIVYALPDNSSDVETQCLASLMHSPKGIRDAVGMLQDDHISDILRPASWIVDHDKSEFQNPKSEIRDPKSKIRSVAIKETLVGGRVHEITGNEKAVTKVSYFKGSDPSKWKTNISTYDVVSLGEVYDGIELKLKAYGNNVEKLFCVKPGANPEQIKVRLSGIQPPESPRGTGSCPPLAGVGGGSWARGLSVNEHGELEVETELGPVKFTKPVAYQEINGKRVDISVEYRIQKSELNPKSAIQNLSSTSIGDPKSTIRHSSPTYGFTVASYNKSHDLIIDPLLASTFLGGSSGEECYSITIDTSGNVYVTGGTYSSDFPTTSGAYDTSYNNGDVFVSKLNSGLTSLLASTYLGGSDIDYGKSLAVDTSGNIYVTGSTSSSDFPTTSGAYDASQNSSYDEVFVSKLDGELTSLLASTYLGGSSSDVGYSLAVDISGNVYVTGYTYSSDFPTTSGVYVTSYSNGSNVFISKLNSGLTSLLASTYLGGSGYYEWGNSLILDTSGNVYVTGYTASSDFPTTSGAYDTSSNGGSSDAFVSKLDDGLTSLLASTYLGGSNDDQGYSLVLDISGNVYVTGTTYSSDFPTTSGAYDTSMGGRSDVFVSKLDGGLTNLLASTYLGGGGSDFDESYSLSLDASGNVYVTGDTYSSDFPTTSGAYDTSFNGGYNDAFISKLDSGLTSLLASTYLGGSGDYDYGYSLTLDTSGNVYVTGYTSSTDFPTTSGAYDSSNSGRDVFVSKLDGNLSAPPPTVTTGNATNVTSNSATLNGTVNPNGLYTTAWFNYGMNAESYTGTSTTQSVSGSSDTSVSIGINGLSPGTTYYYRIAAQNIIGTTYGDEMSFITLSDTSAPTGFVSINNNETYAISTTVILTISAIDDVGVTNYYISENLTMPSALNPGWTSIDSTSNYSTSVSYTLSDGDGDKTVYVWYKDDSGNVSSPASDSIILDTTPPIVTITSPTSDDTYTTTNGKIKVGGSATDSTSGINEITWSNNFGVSGTANGTTGWSILKISLLIGENTITVIATDNAGNAGTDVIIVNRTEGGQGSISGYVLDFGGNPIENAKVRLKRKNSAEKTVSDEDGFFEFEDLAAGTYTVIVRKMGYKISRKTVKLKDDEDVEIEIKMKRQ